MEALQDITPDIEVFSVDEAFLDLTRCKKVYDTTPEVIGMMIKRKVYSVSGVKCSVGISGDKSTANRIVTCNITLKHSDNFIVWYFLFHIFTSNKLYFH